MTDKEFRIDEAINAPIEFSGNYKRKLIEEDISFRNSLLKSFRAKAEEGRKEAEDLQEQTTTKETSCINKPVKRDRKYRTFQYTAKKR